MWNIPNHISSEMKPVVFKNWSTTYIIQYIDILTPSYHLYSTINILNFARCVWKVTNKILYGFYSTKKIPISHPQKYKTNYSLVTVSATRALMELSGWYFIMVVVDLSWAALDGWTSPVKCDFFHKQLLCQK
jgi:hypothetical protein